MPDRCFYCAQQLDPKPDEEHVVPAAVQATLTTRRVCTPCNRKAGRDVDSPWLQHPDVFELRRVHNVLDRRNRPILSREQGVYADGTPALLAFTGDAVEIRPKPHQRPGLDGVTEYVGYTDEQLDRLIARRQTAGDDFVQLFRRPFETLAPQQATVSWELDVDIWPRFAAKVALAAASLVADDDWLDTDLARELRDVLWKGHPSTKIIGVTQPGLAWSILPERLQPDALSPQMRPGEHLVSFQRADRGGFELVVIFFSELRYRIPFDDQVGGGLYYWLLHDRPT